MACNAYIDALELLQDNELVGAERAQLETHLQQCEGCRARVEYLTQYRQMLRERAIEERAPTGLRERIRKTVFKPAPLARDFFLPAWRLAPVTVGVLALAYIFWNTTGGAANALKRDLISTHTRNLPMEMASSNFQDISNWFSGKVDFPVNVPAMPQNFRGQQLEVRGARLSHVREFPAAYVAFSEGGHKYSLLIFSAVNVGVDTLKRRTIQGRPVYLGNENGYTMALWKQRQLVYSLVSDADESEIMDMTAAMLHNGPFIP